MTTTVHPQQHPIPSGFTAASTADDVLAGLDLTGTNVIVTGGSSGLGLETTRALAAAGASVTVATRDVVRAQAAVAGIDGVEVEELDLADPRSVDAFAERYLATGRPLRALINNAGLPASGEILRDARGYEIQFATNHLGHFQLTLALRPALLAAHGARVVNVSSGAQRFSDILWDDPTFATRPYSPLLAYAQSKTANVLFAVELDRRWGPDGIHAFSVHPGVVVGTGLNNTSGGLESHIAQGLVDETGEPIIDPEHGKKTVQQGASTIVFGAVSPVLDGIGGVYLKDADVSRLDDRERPMSAVEPPAEVVSRSLDPGSARRLWELSEELLRSA